MSFIESFGGKWKVKQIPNEEQMAVRLKQNELFQFPPEFFENAKKIVVETGTFPTNNIYEVGDGVYCAKTEFAELTQACRIIITHLVFLSFNSFIKIPASLFSLKQKKKNLFIWKLIPNVKEQISMYSKKDRKRAFQLI